MTIIFQSTIKDGRMIIDLFAWFTIKIVKNISVKKDGATATAIENSGGLGS